MQSTPPDALRWLDEKERITLPLHERQFIERRAELIGRRHIAATGLAHLKAEDAKKLEVLRNGVRLCVNALVNRSSSPQFPNRPIGKNSYFKINGLQLLAISALLCVSSGPFGDQYLLSSMSEKSA
jgi:hypothetical protein